MVRLIVRFCCVRALTLFAGCAGPRTAKEPTPPLPPRNIQAEVNAEFLRSTAGWNMGSLDIFMAIYAEDASFAMRDSFIQGYPSIRAYYAPLFLPGAARGELQLEPLNIEVLAPDIVLVRGVYHSTLNGEVKTGTTTLIMRNIGNHWRIIHDHST